MYNVTLNQIAYSIFESVRGKIGDDDNISIDQIKDMVHNTRALLLKQKFDKNIRLIDDAYTQSIGPVEVEQVDSSIHPDIPSDKYLLRTVVDIPPTIDRRNYEGTFTRIGPAERKSHKFNLVSYDRAIWSGNGRFNRNEVFAFPLDSRIYLISNSIYHKPVQYIDIIGVFENPTQVAMFTDKQGESLYSDESQYPVSRSLRDQIEQIILQRVIPQSAVPSDVVNDSTDTIDAGEARN